VISERQKAMAQELPDDSPPIEHRRKAEFTGQTAEDIYPVSHRRRVAKDDPPVETKEPPRPAQKIPLKSDQKPGKKATGNPPKSPKDAKKDAKTGGTPPPRQRGLRLNSHEDLRRLLCQIINRLLKKQIDHQTAGKVIYAASTMIELIDKSELSDRVKALEDKFSKGRR
jgi:hypothetical protein